jgi:ABC-2 type transport system permease protein
MSRQAGTTSSLYIRYEVLRAFRNWRLLVFSLLFPLILFLLVAGANRHAKIEDIPFPVYYLAGMVAWGAMGAVVAGGGRIAAERSIGWNRQLRLTPLRTWVYFAAKVLTGYAMALLSIVVLDLAALSIGVRLTITEWLGMDALILLGLVPFAALGVLIGHVVTVDSMGPAMGGATSLLALLGGAWGPLGTSGVMHAISLVTPSYWLVQAGGLALAGEVWPLRGWLTLLVWTLVLARLAGLAFRRDTKRV